MNDTPFGARVQRTRYEDRMTDLAGKDIRPPAKGLVAGVELGGTKCICALADEDGAIAAQETVPTSDPRETLAAIEAILGRWWAQLGFRAIGIASFGPVELNPDSERYGFVTSTPKPGWGNTDVGVRLSAPYPVPMAFDTDVNGAALAEQRWGAAHGLADFAYVTVGTGVGVGLIVNGRPTRGLSHCELGHIRVPRLAGDDWAGSCPYHGDCVEGLVAGPAIKARLGQANLSSIEPTHPVWDGVAHALAQLAHVIVLAAGARRILMGGGVIKGQQHLLPMIETKLRESVNGYVRIPDEHDYVRAPGLGDRAGPLGPVALALGKIESASG